MKTGVKTSEFWATAASVVVWALSQTKFFGSMDPSEAEQLLSLGGSTLVAFAALVSYIGGRNSLKRGDGSKSSAELVAATVQAVAEVLAKPPPQTEFDNPPTQS